MGVGQGAGIQDQVGLLGRPPLEAEGEKAQDEACLLAQKAGQGLLKGSWGKVRGVQDQVGLFPEGGEDFPFLADLPHQVSRPQGVEAAGQVVAAEEDLGAGLQVDHGGPELP